jgi:asparagine N-glycosylation enzyme membrane subunit Stt3
MHWPGGFQIITISLTGVVITYAICFINKKKKTILDIFKMLWVAFAAAERISIVGHLVKREYLMMSYLTGWFVILFFVVEEYKKEVSENRATK